MNNCKIKVNDEAESKEAQELFFELGYYWNSGFGVRHLDVNFLYAKNKQITIGYFSEHFSSNPCCELTLPQLRDLVVLHRNDIHDANWVTEGDDQIYQDSNGKSFIFREQGWDELQRHEMRQAMWEKVKPKPKSSEKKQGLISGADAKLAWAKGEDIQISHKHPTLKKEWHDLYGTLMLSAFDSDMYEFRRKPRTITLNVEIPAPFEPKVGDIYYFINSSNLKGYGFNKFANDGDDECLTFYGAWRTEEEIKQVVAALRGGIKA